MNEEQRNALQDFYSAADRLKELNVIRSDKYLGDIAEFLCVSLLGATLAKSGRQPGYDGLIGDTKIQVKYHGGSSTTVECGDPTKYDELILVLGPESVLRVDTEDRRFLIYRVPSSEVLIFPSDRDGQRRYTKGQIPQRFLVSDDIDA